MSPALVAEHAAVEVGRPAAQTVGIVEVLDTLLPALVGHLACTVGPVESVADTLWPTFVAVRTAVVAVDTLVPVLVLGNTAVEVVDRLALAHTAVETVVYILMPAHAAAVAFGWVCKKPTELLAVGLSIQPEQV